ncbi:hypothetical protein GCM10010969_15820 [Saccharibacillus kuerlensis]|uniref:Uncharacterized protein n=1 Tax=Saccharibacillus kuerlensis TaxID=459527 RepID=A0ABQ2KZ85_9BACL|nr:hypothetical protein GCM10010969_15820 [Saccharibacillus kuerlensis]
MAVLADAAAGSLSFNFTDHRRFTCMETAWKQYKDNKRKHKDSERKRGPQNGPRFFVLTVVYFNFII